MRKPFFPFSIIFLTLLFYLSCKKEERFGRVVVKMTDAPALYSEVVVEVTGVDIHYANSSFGDAGWINVEAKSGTYDLLKLRNNVTAVIAEDGKMPAGKVTQIRLYLGTHNYVRLEDGTVFTLTAPSTAQTGIKINMNSEILPDKTLTVVLDFEAEESVHVTGSLEYKLNPVIKVKSVTNE